MRPQYDAIVVLGYSFNYKWQLPKHLVKRLKLTSNFYKKGLSKKVVVTGNHSIHWDWAKIKVPLRECDVMKDVLMSEGLPSEFVIKECISKDTPGNIFYLKNKILIPNRFSSILIMCASHHKERVNFLCKKILGPDFNFTIQTTPSPGSSNPEFIKHEKNILAEQKEWLKTMPEGEDSWLKDKFYSDSYYQKQILNPRRNRDMEATIVLANLPK